MAPQDQGNGNVNAKHTVIQRRSHTKSRGGCLSCKARRIKCSEEKPTCTHCKLKSKPCEYPAPRLNPVNLRFQTGRSVSLPTAPSLPVSSVNDQFTLRDLRLFHHFLNHAYPSLPLGNQAIWIRDVPQLVYEYDHLMHALLALSASHIGSRMANTADTNKDNYSALTHRGHAIAGLKKAFSRNDNSSSESDSMLATCYALAFQSAHIKDGGLDFATFVRGCAMITRRIQEGVQSTIFNLSADPSQCPTKLSLSSHSSALVDFSVSSPLAELLGWGIEAVKNTERYLTQHLAERNFYHAIQATFVALGASPAKGYAQFLGFYAVWFKMAGDSLQLHFEMGLFRDSAQLLWSYFIGLQLLIVLLVNQAAMEKGTNLLEEDTDLRRARISKLTSTFAWFQAIVKNTAHDLLPCVKWPQRVVEEVGAVFNVPSPSEKEIQKVAEFLQNLEPNAHTVLASILDISATLSNWTEACVARMPRPEGKEIFQIDGVQQLTFPDDNSTPSSHEYGSGQDVGRHTFLEVPILDGKMSNLEYGCGPLGSGENYPHLHTDLDILYRSDMLHLHSKLMD